MLYSNFVQNTYPKIIFDDDKFLEIYGEKNKNSNSMETIKAIRISVKYRHVYRPIIPLSLFYYFYKFITFISIFNLFLFISQFYIYKKNIIYYFISL